MSTDNVAARVGAIVARVFSVDASTLTPETDFSEALGADSLDAIELVMAVEDEFDIEITDDEAETLLTFGDLVAHVGAKTGGGL